MSEEPSNSPSAATLPFQAEVQQVLGLVINSLYANKEVFLRELVSNAADALDRARFLTLTRKDVAEQVGEPRIALRVDDEARTLTIEDNGVGMTRDELVQNLGTIARSGSLEFLKANAEAAKKAGGLSPIGQFGVGFYAAFMVASRVDVHTRSMLPGAEPWTWRSDGSSTFTVAPGERAHPGTEIVLHLTEEAREFGKAWRVRELVAKYSDFVAFPIHLGEEVINRAKALWALPKSQVSDEQHTEFFRHLTGGHEGEAPLLRVHTAVDAPVQFSALLYVPPKAPLDLFARERRGLRLYARRVLVLEHCDKIAPVYLRFLRGVVDSEDLSLNVSREMLQEDKALHAIEQQITKQVLRALDELAAADADKYATFWREYGRVLKEGVSVDWKNRDGIAALCRFESMRGEEGKLLSLREYVAAMPEGQKEIYYVTGLSRRAVERSPHLEAFRKRGFDVLFLTDPVDEWLVQALPDFEKVRLRSVTRGEIDLGGEPEPEAAAVAAAAVEVVKSALGERVKDVRLSRRLTDSASCLVADEGDPGANMERIMKMIDGSTKVSKRVLELNAGHPAVKNLDVLAAREPGSERVRAFAELLYDQALLAEGVVEDPARLVKRIEELLVEVSAAATKV